MALSTVWYFTDVGPLNGSTWVVPGSHRDLRNPRGADDDVDEHSPIAGEIQVIPMHLTAPGVPNEGPSSRVLAPLPAVSRLLGSGLGLVGTVSSRR